MCQSSSAKVDVTVSGICSDVWCQWDGDGCGGEVGVSSEAVKGDCESAGVKTSGNKLNTV